MAIGAFKLLIADLQNKSSSRDPRLVRLASVSAAIVDVIKQEGLEVSPPRVYSKAVITLEGALQKKHVEIDQFVDAVYTQISLLDLLHLVLPHLDKSTVSATFVPVGRAIRNLMDLMGSVSMAKQVLNTKDDIGCVASILSTTAKTSSTLIKCISTTPNSVDTKALRAFFRDTLQELLGSGSQRVRRAAGRSIGDLLSMDNPKCHHSVLHDVNANIMSSLDSIVAASDPVQKCGDMKGVLDLIQSNAMFLDGAIGQKLMLVFLSLVNQRSATGPDFVMNMRDSNSLVLGINVILSAVVGLLECGHDEVMVNEYSGRVMATLLQVEPRHIFIGTNPETGSAGRQLFAQAILTAARRLVTADSKTAAVLLPLAINRLFSLACNQRECEDEYPLSQKWFLELSQILRVNLPSMKAEDSFSHAKCCLASFQVAKQVVTSTDQWVYDGALICLVELILQLETQLEIVEKTVKALISCRDRAGAMSASAVALEDAIYRVVEGLGIEEFWALVDFPLLCVENTTSNYSWLVKVMRLAGSSMATGCASLAFFHNEVIPLTREFDANIVLSNANSNGHRQNFVELWSLLPCFCVNPTDITASLPKIAPILVRAMKDKRYPQLLISISTAMDVLAQGQNGKFADATLSEESEAAQYRSDIMTVKQFSETMLPTLFKLVDDLYCAPNPMDDGDASIGGEMRSSLAHALTGAIASLAMLASKELLQNRLFTRVLHRLLEASQSEEDLSDQMCSLLTLSQALYTSGCLSEPSVILLYRALRPLIGSDETTPRVQKRCYKLLSELCKSKAFITSEGRLTEIVDLLSSSTSSSQIAARSRRLRCVATITDSLRGSPELEQWVLASLLAEILLCLKDSKNETRESASSLLISVSRDVDIVRLIRGIAAALASETSHMRSAAIAALAKVVLEYGESDQRVQNLIPSLLQTVLLLSSDPSREVSKSTIAFLRVSISMCPPEMMRPLLPSVLECLVSYHMAKDRFRGKIRITMKKLVRLFGFDYLLPLVTESASQLINYVKKLAKPENKAKKTTNDRVREKTVDEMMASDEEDSGDDLKWPDVDRGRGLNENRRRRGYHEEGGSARDSSQVLIRNNDFAGLEVKDLARTVDHESDSDDDGGITFDDRGRLVVTTRSNDARQNPEDYIVSLTNSSMARHMEKRVHVGQEQRGKKLGAAYKSKKAGGDVKRKGQKFDPYAYVPLDGKSYTKKNRRQAVDQLDSVVRGRKRQKR